MVDEEKWAMVRSFQRDYIGHQVDVSDAIDSKLETLLRTTIALLGLGIIVLRVALQGLEDPVSYKEPALVVLYVGGILNVISILIFIHAYVGLPGLKNPKIDPGPDPEWLADIAENKDWEAEALNVSLVRGMRQITLANEEEITRVTKHRRVAFYLAFLAFVAYAVSVLKVGPL